MQTRSWIRRVLELVLIIGGLAACATPIQRVFDAPAPAVPTPNKKLFTEAFQAQQKGQYSKAIGLWKEYLRVEPDSFEGRNNLGMVYYAEDRLPDSIAVFQEARQLAPENPIIQRNLSRSLQFQIALLKENREYERAIEHLKTLQQISPPADFQKVQFMIEGMEDRVFEQVQNANSADEYRRFLEQYPRGINADRARQKLADLEEKHSSVIQSFEDRQPVGTEGVLEKLEQESPLPMATIQEEDITAPSMPSPVTEESTLPSETSEVMEETVSESPVAAMEPEAGTEAPATVPVETSPETPPQVAETPAELPEEVAPVEPEPAPQQQARVMITLKSSKSVLRVRAMPTTKGKILTRLKNGEIRPLIKEMPDWYQIEYSKGKIGWISKKFSRKLEPGSANSEPQARLQHAGSLAARFQYSVQTTAIVQP